jgi:hypothetical protein
MLETASLSETALLSNALRMRPIRLRREAGLGNGFRIVETTGEHSLSSPLRLTTSLTFTTGLGLIQHLKQQLSGMV